MNIGSTISKKQFDDEFARHERYKSNLGKTSKGVEIEKIVG